MSLEGGREGGEGRGGEGERGREGGGGGMTVIHIVLAPQYLNSNHVTYYVITYVDIRLGLRRTMVRKYYVRRDVDTQIPSQINSQSWSPN